MLNLDCCHHWNIWSSTCWTFVLLLLLKPHFVPEIWYFYIYLHFCFYMSRNKNNITVFCLSVELLHLEEDEDECLVGWHYYLFSNWYSVYPRRLGSTLIPIWGPCILANKSATVKQNSLWLSWHCATKKFSLYHKKINWTIWFGLVVLSYFQNIKAVLKQYMINVSACV